MRIGRNNNTWCSKGAKTVSRQLPTLTLEGTTSLRFVQNYLDSSVYVPFEKHGQLLTNHLI